MEREFEKLERNLDNADINDIMPSFDKQREWNDLQERLDQSNKKMILPLWFRYAAAVLVAVLLGGVVANKWMTNKEEIVAQENQIPTPKTITINKPQEPPIANEKKTTPLKEVVTAQKVDSKKNLPAVEKHEQPTVRKEAIAKAQKPIVAPQPKVEAPIEYEKEIVTTVPSPLKKKVIHLLDIDNEDREVVLSDPKSASSTFQLMMKQVAHTHTRSVNSTHQPIVIRKMLKK